MPGGGKGSPGRNEQRENMMAKGISTVIGTNCRKEGEGKENTHL